MRTRKLTSPQRSDGITVLQLLETLHTYERMRVKKANSVVFFLKG